jgi:hypothetical protein
MLRLLLLLWLAPLLVLAQAKKPVPAPKPTTIFLVDGSRIVGRVVRLTDQVVEYRIGTSATTRSVFRSKVRRIEFANGTTTIITPFAPAAPTVVNAPASTPAPVSDRAPVSSVVSEPASATTAPPVPVLSAPVITRRGGGRSLGGGGKVSFGKLLDESAVFVSKSNFIWLDYELSSTIGSRQTTGLVIPPVALNYERQFWKGLGIRAMLATHWWRENITLAEAGTTQFRQLFTYRYFTGGLGLSYHFTISPKIDPYIGVMVSYRRLQAECDCYTIETNQISPDAYIGLRYFLGTRLFLVGEGGQHGVGFVKFGAGLRL